ncbi:hypothetical protein AY599_10860 [Leptolyngbya valderiana BDU 20041]|nr:hypothetical protein [Geitlerinema sp. CS-897]OAB60248.1 hypothetical protein AY599_10860 [Leptolyngbya valderiana BDU 20041]PPT05064.1 hypothetical protein CKA32_002747 [Geitlerinema sp. FC II]
MNKLKTQFATVGELVFSPNTGETYSKAFQLTWNIVKETALLLWMMFCLVFLIFVWGWGYATQIGRNAKVWYENQERRDHENLFNEAGKALLSASSSGTAFAIDRAKEQLGIENDPQPIQAIEPLPANETVTVTSSESSESDETTVKTPLETTSETSQDKSS